MYKLNKIKKMTRECISEAPKIYKVDGFIEEAHPGLRNKIVPQEELPNLGEFYRNRGRMISFTSGTFDMIHIGHGRYLELARSLAGQKGILVVGLNSDLSVRRYKGPDRPILSEIKRAEMLAYLECVDYIALYDEMTADSVIRLLKPDRYLCVEGSWPEGTELKDKPEVVAMAEHWGEIYCAPRQDPVLSTSAIVERIMVSGKHEAVKQLKELMDRMLPDLEDNKSL